MIGDAAARGKRKSTTKEDSSQIKRGKRYITNTPSASDGGGDTATKSTACKAAKGMKSGTGTKDKQNPGHQRSRQLSTLDLWCLGK
jgi:hypothetical protein